MKQGTTKGDECDMRGKIEETIGETIELISSKKIKLGVMKTIAM